MKKSFIVAVVLVAMAAMSAQAVPLTVYDGKNAPKGTQIFLMSPSVKSVGDGEYHIPGPTESYVNRRNARHMRALQAAEERLARKEMLTPSEVRTLEEQYQAEEPVETKASAEVLEKLSKPAPMRGGIKMGRFGAAETPKAEPALAAAPMLEPAVVSAKDLPVYHAPKVSMPKGFYSFGTAESPFTAKELLRLAKRGCLNMHLRKLDNGDFVVDIMPEHKQWLWIVIEPACMSRGKLGGLKGKYPLKHLSWKASDTPMRVRIQGGAITFRGDVVNYLLRDDNIGADSDVDPVLRQEEIVLALRKKCRTDRGWGAILMRMGIGIINGLGIKVITGSDDGRDVQAYLDIPKWEMFGMIGQN